MKKIIAILLSTILLLASCATNNPPAVQNNEEPKTYTIKDYFPFEENRRMKYEGIGNEFAEKDVYVDFIKDNRIQLRVINPGTTLGQVYEIQNGELRLIRSQEEFYYRDDLLDSQNSNPEILLKEPLKKGTTWTLKDGIKRYISEVNKKINTPYGEYEALEVTTEGKDYKIYDYYVLNLGHVKSVFESNGNVVETNLEKVENNAFVTQTVKFYYPDFLNNRIVFKNEEIQFKTNETVIEKFLPYLKNAPNENLTNIIGPNTKINRLYLNQKENKVYIDLSKEFITDMNAGASLESMIIQSLVNTLGDYYNVDKVYISIEGKPYESGHIAISENEYFKVDYNNVVEFK